MALMEEKEAVKHENKQLKTVNEILKTVSSLESKKLDLSKRCIKDFPSELNSLKKLEFLYLEGNLLTCLPDEFFTSLPHLKWLDLRNNQIKHLPVTIGESRHLRSLLLENNRITKLPLELGFVQSLSGLHLVGNPLDFPPPSIRDQGVQVILAFLRDEWLKRHKEDDDDLSLDDETDKKEHDEIKPDERKERAQSSTRDIASELKLPPINANLSTILRNANSPENRKLNAPETGRKSARMLFHKQKPIANDNSLRRSPSKDLSDNIQKGNMLGKIRVITSENRAEESIARNKTKSPKKRPSKHKKSKQSKDPSTIMTAQVKDGGTVSLTYKTETKEKLSSDQGNKQQESEVMCEEKHEIKGEETEEMIRAQELFESVTISEDQKQNTPMKYSPSDLSVNDMVVVKVPNEHFIPGQPCLGKIVSLPDAAGSLLVHYYSGSYDGVWKPMMSRSSPYLRRVPLNKVVYKFDLDEIGRMSKETIEKVKEAIIT